MRARIQGTFREDEREHESEDSGNIQGPIESLFGEHSGTIQGTTFRDRSGAYIQGTLMEHSGNILEKFREHSGNIQGTFREHSGNIQGTFRERSLTTWRAGIWRCSASPFSPISLAT
jgi:hypothetical protein